MTGAKVAKAQAEAVIMQKKATGEIDWDLKMADASAHSWKDEWLTILFSIPLILSFCGDWGREIVTNGFAALESMPDYYPYTLGTIVAASFGTRAATKFSGRSDAKIPRERQRLQPIRYGWRRGSYRRGAEHAKDIKKTETELRKNVAQLRMARYTLIFMGFYAAFLASPWCSAEKLEGLGAVTDLIFLSGAGIVGAYMGTTAWMSKK